MENEVWRPIRGYEDFYEVSNFGRVRRWRYLQGAVNRRVFGYKRMELPRVNGHRNHVMLHEAFVGPPPSMDHEINHKDGDPFNNRPENLEWVTHGENIHHAHLIGHKKSHRALSPDREAELAADFGNGMLL